VAFLHLVQYSYFLQQVVFRLYACGANKVKEDESDFGCKYRRRVKRT